MKIALIPNDDGFGPSALGYHVAKALLKMGHHIVILNKSAISLNANFYQNEIRAGTISLKVAFGGIRMQKTADGVDVEGTLHEIQKYPRFSDQYQLPGDVAVVIDIGTPAAARAARLGQKPVFTVFDHSWGKTYEQTLELAPASYSTDPVASAVNRIKSDEAKTSGVFLFDTYLAPEPFQYHWRSVGVPLTTIKGVFGGSTVSRGAAREIIGIPDGAPEQTVYIMGGGTPVWDAKLPEMISQLKAEKLDFNIIVFDRKAKVSQFSKLGPNLYLGGAIKGDTIQGVLPGIDLVITRAGGGIVNDAIACRVPFVSVEEPNHWQVEMIRKNCMHEGLTRTITIDEFRHRGIAQIAAQELKRDPDNNAIQKRMHTINNGMEDFVAKEIMRRCEFGMIS